MGLTDTYVTKFDSAGNLLWTTQYGTSVRDSGQAIAISASGSVFVSGFTDGTFGSASAGGRDVFVTKMDANGVIDWSAQVGSAAADQSWTVAVDGFDNAYVGGITDGDLAGTNAGESDLFLSKIDPTGAHVWSTQIGTAGDEASFELTVDDAGNAFLTGNTYGDLGGTNAGLRDVVLTRFDIDGNEVWTKQVGTASEDYGRAVAIDDAGNILLAGHSDGGLGGPNAGDLDIFLMKLDAAGNELWTTSLGAAAEDRALGIDLDPTTGNVYLTGYTTSDLFATNAGDDDAILVQFIVPEPATMGMLALGGLAMLRRRRQ